MNKWNLLVHLLDIYRFTSPSRYRWFWVAGFACSVFLGVTSGPWWLLVFVPGALWYGWLSWPTLMGRHSPIWARGPFKRGQRVRLFERAVVYPSVGDVELILDTAPSRDYDGWIARRADGKPIKDGVTFVPIHFGEFALAELFKEQNENNQQPS